MTEDWLADNREYWELYELWCADQGLLPKYNYFDQWFEEVFL